MELGLLLDGVGCRWDEVGSVHLLLELVLAVVGASVGSIIRAGVGSGVRLVGASVGDGVGSIFLLLCLLLCLLFAVVVSVVRAVIVSGVECRWRCSCRWSWSWVCWECNSCWSCTFLPEGLQKPPTKRQCKILQAFQGLKLKPGTIAPPANPNRNRSSLQLYRSSNTSSFAQSPLNRSPSDSEDTINSK